MDANEQEQLLAMNKGRAEFYRILAHLYFRELTQEQIEHLASLDFSDMAAGDALMAEGYEDIRRYLRRLDTGTRQELAVDYAHTFLAAGNYETFAATPYESVFTSEVGLLMQEARDEVYKAYCEERIQPQESLQVPEDHVSFEFEFMATLIERTNEALAAGEWRRAAECAQKAADFQKKHQANWVEDLCDAILDVAQTRFYRGVSKVTRAFVRMEADVTDDEAALLEELLAENAA